MCKVVPILLLRRTEQLPDTDDRAGSNDLVNKLEIEYGRYKLEIEYGRYNLLIH